MSLKIAKIVTIAIIISTVSLWICWDIVVAALGLFPATESRILLAFAYVNISFPAALGILLGHLFWPVKKEVSHQLARILVMAGYAVALITLNALRVLPDVVPVLPLVIHIPVGHLLWPQRVEGAVQ